MNRRALHSVLALCGIAAALAAEPGCSFETLEDHPCPPGGTTLTYENFGQFFFNTWCNTCHSAELENRQGAPENYVFNTRAEVVELKDRIFVRAAGENSSMPPGPNDPPLDQREDLANWLACGAK